MLLRTKFYFTMNNFTRDIDVCLDWTKFRNVASLKSNELQCMATTFERILNIPSAWRKFAKNGGYVQM